MFFNKYFNASNDEEVVISNDVQQENAVDIVEKQEVVVAKQQQSYNNIKYDARFNADEESYAKAYALAKSAQTHSQKALAEQEALAEQAALTEQVALTEQAAQAEKLETEVKQESDWFTLIKSGKNRNKYLYPYGVEPPMSTMPILFIEEFVPPQTWSQSPYATTDWRVYIFYDATTKSYVLNGTRRRRGESKTFHPDIRMTFASKSSLAFYLRRSMCARRHDLSITLYSISRSVLHILSTPNAIPNFHSIHHSRSKFRSELFGYDNCHPSTREVKTYLKLLKDVGDSGFMFR